MTATAERGNRAEEERRERRRKPGALSAQGKRLVVDESKLDRNKFEYRFANDTKGRLQQLHADDYDPAPEGESDHRLAGTDETGKPFNAVLMRKRKDWYDDDQKEKMRPLKEMDDAIRRGDHRADGEPDMRSGTYTPGGRNTIE
jgi:hypothetical protein